MASRRPVEPCPRPALVRQRVVASRDDRQRNKTEEGGHDQHRPRHPSQSNPGPCVPPTRWPTDVGIHAYTEQPLPDETAEESHRGDLRCEEHEDDNRGRDFDVESAERMT